MLFEVFIVIKNQSIRRTPAVIKAMFYDDRAFIKAFTKGGQVERSKDAPAGDSPVIRGILERHCSLPRSGRKHVSLDLGSPDHVGRNPLDDPVPLRRSRYDGTARK